MTHYVTAGETREGNAAHLMQHLQGIYEAALLTMVQVNLRDVAGDHGLAAETDAGEKHFHLFRRGVLSFIEDDEGMIERTSAHISQRRDFNGLFFKQSLGTVKTEQIVQRVIQRAQIRIDLLRQIARQKTQSFTSFYRWPRQHNALHGVALESIDGASHRQISLAGAGRADAEGDVMLQNRIEVLTLMRGAATQIVFAGLQHRAFDLALFSGCRR